MSGINGDMDSYLRKRKSNGLFSFGSGSPSGNSGPSWWSGILSGKQPRDENLNTVERGQLDAMENEMRARKDEIEHVKEYEDELEEQQEREVGLYHRLRRFFGGSSEPRDEDDAAFAAVQAAEAAQNALNTPDIQADFRALAQIQMHWLGRMPTRVMQEFKESEDFVKLTEILQRRGVAKKKTE